MFPKKRLVLRMAQHAAALPCADWFGTGARPVGVRPSMPTADDLLDAFLERVDREDASSAPSAWGEKVGFSIYDEREVLGTGTVVTAQVPDDSARWIDELLDDLAQIPGWEDEDEEDDEDDEDSVVESARAADMLSRGKLPRAAMSALPFCRAYCLGEDSADSCSICLEGLARGQQAWRLPCTHLFHGGCIARAFSTRTSRIRFGCMRGAIRRTCRARLIFNRLGRQIDPRFIRIGSGFTQFD